MQFLSPPKPNMTRAPPDAKGVIHDSDDKPKGDGGEESDEDITPIKIRCPLPATAGKARMDVDILSDDAFDQSGNPADTTTYRLSWRRELADGVYINIENPPELNGLVESCDQVVAPTIGRGISDEADICTSSVTVISHRAKAGHLRLSLENTRHPNTAHFDLSHSPGMPRSRDCRAILVRMARQSGRSRISNNPPPENRAGPDDRDHDLREALRETPDPKFDRLQP